MKLTSLLRQVRGSASPLCLEFWETKRKSLEVGHEESFIFKVKPDQQLTSLDMPPTHWHFSATVFGQL